MSKHTHGLSHYDLAFGILCDLESLEALGGWPKGEREKFIDDAVRHGAYYSLIARVIGVTHERVRQIHKRSSAK